MIRYSPNMRLALPPVVESLDQVIAAIEHWAEVAA